MNDNATRAATPREGSCLESCSAFRIGLPILPVRYAVVDEGSGLPTLDKAFADPSLPGLAKAARYGLRLLRRGFLYVYNENYGALEGYLVTRKGTSGHRGKVASCDG